MDKSWNEFLVPFFRKRCSLKNAGVFFIFDSSKDVEGVKMLVDDYIGSEEFMAEQLKERLNLSLKDAVMFGVTGFMGDYKHMKNCGGINGRSLENVIGSLSQIICILFYNPDNGICYINSGGTFMLYPDMDDPKTIDQLGIIALD
jgi:hypothetical protein